MELATYLEEKQREPPPAISMLISISEKVTISFIGQDGKRETIYFTHPGQAALIAFFAVQRRGMWIPRGHVIKQVYGAKSGHLFALHTSRIHAAINQVARDAGFLSQKEGEAGQQSEKLKLFEFNDGGQEQVWRRVVSCEVEVLDDLNAFYERFGDQVNRAELHYHFSYHFLTKVPPHKRIVMLHIYVADRIEQIDTSRDQGWRQHARRREREAGNTRRRDHSSDGRGCTCWQDAAPTSHSSA